MGEAKTVGIFQPMAERAVEADMGQPDHGDRENGKADIAHPGPSGPLMTPKRTRAIPESKSAGCCALRSEVLGASQQRRSAHTSTKAATQAPFFAVRVPLTIIILTINKIIVLETQ
jgi:hypothetical protein